MPLTWSRCGTAKAFVAAGRAFAAGGATRAREQMLSSGGFSRERYLKVKIHLIRRSGGKPAYLGLLVAA